VNSVLKGGQYPAYNLTHQYTAGFAMPEIDYASWTQADRDAKAVELMTEAGYGPDKPLDLTLIYNTSDAHKALATVVAQMARQKLGVNITLANYEWKTYLEVRSSQQFDLARYAWCGDYNEASTFLNIMTTGNENNDGKWSNAEYDALMAEAKSLADPGPNYSKAEQIMAADMPILPLYQYTSNFMLNSSIKGYPYDNVQNNWYAKDMYRVAE
jgi:oligopeptide transport system substrate-binding protein